MKNKKIKALFLAIAIGLTGVASPAIAGKCLCDDLSLVCWDVKVFRQCYVGVAKSENPEDRFCGYSGLGDLFSGDNSLSGLRSRIKLPESEKDFPKALKCYLRAYDAAVEAYKRNTKFVYEVYDTAVRIGELYYFGAVGIPADKTKSFSWFQKALPLSSKDHRNSNISSTSSRLFCYLGESYLKGFGTHINGPKALEYINRSTLRDNRVALFIKATMYEDGVFVKKDLKRALSLYSSSYSKGFKKAKEPMDRIIKKFEDDLNLD